MYGLSNGWNIFDLTCLLRVKSQGRTVKPVKSNISGTVRDIEKVLFEVSRSYVWSFDWRKYFWPPMTFKGQIKGQRARQNPNIFKVKYLRNRYEIERKFPIILFLYHMPDDATEGVVEPWCLGCNHQSTYMSQLQIWCPMYYPEGSMKARVSPVQSSEPHRILAPTRDSNPGPPGPRV